MVPVRGIGDSPFGTVPNFWSPAFLAPVALFESLKEGDGHFGTSPAFLRKGDCPEGTVPGILGKSGRSLGTSPTFLEKGDGHFGTSPTFLEKGDCPEGTVPGTHIVGG